MGEADEDRLDWIGEIALASESIREALTRVGPVRAREIRERLRAALESGLP